MPDIEDDFADLLALHGGSVGTITVDGEPMGYWLPDGVTLDGIAERIAADRMIAAVDDIPEDTAA